MAPEILLPATSLDPTTGWKKSMTVPTSTSSRDPCGQTSRQQRRDVLHPPFVAEHADDGPATQPPPGPLRKHSLKKKISAVYFWNCEGGGVWKTDIYIYIWIILYTMNMKSDDRFTIPFRFLASSLCLWLVCGCHPQVVYLFPALEHDSGFFINHLDTEEKAFAMKKSHPEFFPLRFFLGLLKALLSRMQLMWTLLQLLFFGARMSRLAILRQEQNPPSC